MEIINLLNPLQIFENLGKDVISTAATRMTRRNLVAGETLFSQGDAGDALYIIESGMLRVSVSSGGSATTFTNDFKAGDCVGEMSLLTGQPRTATITALENSVALRLAKADFDELAEKYPELLVGLAHQLLPHFLHDQTRAALKNFFGEIDDDLLRELLKNLDCGRCRSGEILFKEGDPGDAMYIVIQGRLRAVKKGADGSERVTKELGAGDCVGELALLSEKGSPESLQTETTYATRLTDMIVISRPVFEKLLQAHPQTLLHLTRKLVQRAVNSGKTNSQSGKGMVITLLPARFGQNLEAFTEQLTQAMSTLGPTLTLDTARFEQLYGKRGISQTPNDHPLSPVINAWLDERERQHYCTIYEVSPVLESTGQLTAWAQRCVEDADLILLVGAADADPLPTGIEAALNTTQTCARMELALTHPANCEQAQGTAKWLALRSGDRLPIREHHHVRMGNLSDFRRLARRVVGKPVGIAFAGGSARGWAHLGALRALEETGIEFDWVAGASMGSIVAAGCALDWSSAQLRELAAKFSKSKELLDYTFPYAAFTATRHINRLLKTLYAGNIEDAWRPFFCVSANLTQIKEIMHVTGPLWKAVRASMAFPGIFAPVMDENGDVLLDGGAANNLPVDRMREVCPTGTVIGVDLLTGSSVSGKYHFGDSLSGWQALMGRVTPFPGSVQAPHLFDIMAGLVEGVCHYRLNEVKHCADLLIQIPVQAYGLLDFDKYAEIIEVGYRATLEQVKDFTPAK